MLEWIVDEERPVRLINFMTRSCPLLPPAKVRQAVKGREVKVNGVRVGENVLLQPGDRVTAYLVLPAFRPEIVYEDEELLALFKPAGLPSVGPGSLENLLKGEDGFPRAVHRLDTDTFGVILFAKNAPAETELLQAFSRRTLDKRYRCIVLGRPKPAAGMLAHHALKDAGAARLRVLDRPAPGSKSIVTGYRTLALSGELALLEVELHTGRTHQIRAHLAHMGWPILGDDKYGNRAANKRHHLRKPQLCCHMLTLHFPKGSPLERLDGLTLASPQTLTPEKLQQKG
ncbi:RluA family pseudouridine synthase [Gehongia tenuis]|uniref:RNA pseudouridylate synthase n=1 Tax=Gehongia tenuis TaxID=2763655 RepID=A0A926D4Q6_9FIRM|nr:RluA family pseudouridine synthase [Gehongia tenuis]MBC8531427.1 RluA family pseudouridine synthase [Gehongia tenuis]